MKYEKLFENIENFKIKGITKTVIPKLNKLGIHTLYDLLYYFPKKYEHIQNNKEITKLLDGEQVVLEGYIKQIRTRYIGAKIMVTALFYNPTGELELVWFNNKFVGYNLKKGDYIRISGKVNKKFKIQIINPVYNKIMMEFPLVSRTEKQIPVYSLTQGIKQNKLGDIILTAIDKYGHLLEENIPLNFIEKYNIMPRQEAIANMHNPTSDDKLNKAHQRLLFEELIILETYILYNRYINDLVNKNQYKIEEKKELTREYVNSLSFDLTKSQQSVITKIYKQINKGNNINILIQGDVGSGKTVVSLICMLYLIDNGYQTVIMAPTEILATQHYNNFKKELEKIGFTDIVYIASSVKGKKREKVLEEIKNGTAKLIVGTHSLIEDNIIFDKLGLVVIDEQHKFGVLQRQKLTSKAILKNLIVMSATPIPRSLALTIYGDLDVLTIKEMPKGRKKIITEYVYNDKMQENMYSFIKSKLEKKMQVYVVSPLIDESEKLNAASAMETYKEYTKIFNNAKIKVFHGKQTAKEKKEIIDEFLKGDIDILISTTVIEVGVDVKNANIIVIRSADRFGLSSLHQLRGRVGRGETQSYCFLESFTTNEISKKRLEILEQTTDGFLIAQKDLELRSSGEIFGEKQSGLSDLVLVDLVKHQELIQIVIEYIKQYLEDNDGEIRNKYLLLDIKNKQKILEYEEVK